MKDKTRITRAEAYALTVPEDPSPFTMRDFIADAFTHGYETAMKDGLDNILQSLEDKNYALQYEADEKEKIESMLFNILSRLENIK